MKSRAMQHQHLAPRMPQYTLNMAYNMNPQQPDLAATTIGSDQRDYAFYAPWLELVNIPVHAQHTPGANGNIGGNPCPPTYSSFGYHHSNSLGSSPSNLPEPLPYSRTTSASYEGYWTASRAFSFPLDIERFHSELMFRRVKHDSCAHHSHHQPPPKPCITTQHNSLLNGDSLTGQVSRPLPHYICPRIHVC